MKHTDKDRDEMPKKSKKLNADISSQDIHSKEGLKRAHALAKSLLDEGALDPLATPNATKKPTSKASAKKPSAKKIDKKAEEKSPTLPTAKKNTTKSAPKSTIKSSIKSTKADKKPTRTTAKKPTKKSALKPSAQVIDVYAYKPKLCDILMRYNPNIPTAIVTDMLLDFFDVDSRKAKEILANKKRAKEVVIATYVKDIAKARAKMARDFCRLQGYHVRLKVLGRFPSIYNGEWRL